MINSQLKIYNTLSKKKENFKPLNGNLVTMYACGITPQSPSHVGHIVAALRFAAIRRYLEFVGYKVAYVENITDIDDKIIAKSKEQGRSVTVIAEENYNEYRGLLNYLGVPSPSYTPKVSEYIDKIINYVQDLIDSGYAYTANNGDVYFDISKKADYYKLSGRNIDDNLSATRVKEEINKRSYEDFALWKVDQNDLNGQFSWLTPWKNEQGHQVYGRPGWHIECSVMANDLLGSTIDIHCGGLDLLFPHHENEIVQCEAHNNCEFARFWAHCGLLNIDGVKMSKSLNNFITAKEACARYGKDLLIWTTLKHNYRSSIDINDRLYLDSLNQILNFYSNFESVKLIGVDALCEDLDIEILNDFVQAMDNDFQTQEVIVNFAKILFSNDTNPKKIKTVYCLGKTLGLFNSKAFSEVQNDLLSFFNSATGNSLSVLKINNIINEIINLRANKNYIDSDKLRDQLLSQGIKLKYVGGVISWEFDLSS